MCERERARARVREGNGKRGPGGWESGGRAGHDQRFGAFITLARVDHVGLEERAFQVDAVECERTVHHALHLEKKKQKKKEDKKKKKKKKKKEERGQNVVIMSHFFPFFLHKTYR